MIAARRARTKARRCRCMRTAAWMTVAALLRRRCLASLRAAMPLAPACSRRSKSESRHHAHLTSRMTKGEVQAAAAQEAQTAGGQMKGGDDCPERRSRKSDQYH